MMPPLLAPTGLIPLGMMPSTVASVTGGPRLKMRMM
jgi:hypothetical protein